MATYSRNRWGLRTLVAACALAALAGPAGAVPISAGLELWLDATDTTTLYQDQARTVPVTTAGQNVRGWEDKSGQANHATTGGTAPTYQAGVIGGEDVVRFNRSQLTISGGIAVPSGQDRTAFVVMNYSTLTQNNEVFGTSTGNMADVGTWTLSERLRLRQTNNVFSAAGSVPTGPNLLAIQGDGLGTRAWRNGTGIITNSGTYFHWGMNSNLGVGGANFGGREYIGDLAELVVYDRALSSWERNLVGYQLQTKYGLSGSYTPSPVPPAGLTLWLDASDAESLSLSGNNVTEWRDKSGNLHHATPMHATSPQYVASGINGLPAIEFNQANRTVMSLAGDLGIAAGQERTLFLVMDYDTYLNNNELLGNSTGQMADVGTWTPTGPQNGRLRLRDGGLSLFSPAGSLPTGTHLLTLLALDSGTVALRDGSIILSDPQLAAHFGLGTGVKIGGTDFNGRDYDGLLAEVLIYGRRLNIAELHQVGYYLERKYGLETGFILYPEPGTVVLLGAGALGLLRRRARRGR